MEKEIEANIRKFLIEELMKEQAEFTSLKEDLILDSLDQTELRAYLEEEYGIDTSFDKVDPDSLSKLENIVKLVIDNRQVPVA